MNPDEPESLRYDCALAAALLILELYDSSPGAPKHQLLSTTVFTVLEAMKRYESEKHSHVHGFSAN